MRILMIEDEIHLAETIEQILKKNKYTVDVSNDGESGYEKALSEIYDLILLDIMLPKMNGITVLKKIRERKINVPIILLTAKGELEDRVLGLDNGADDYLPKPFETAELLARIRANLRRRNDELKDNQISYSDIELDKQNLLLYKNKGKDKDKDKEKIGLTLKEAELMEFFMERKKFVSSKDSILDKVWGYDTEAYHNHVEVYISFLRKKLEHINSLISIKTIRGVGYTLEEKNEGKK